MMTIRNPEDKTAMREILATLYSIQAYRQYLDFIAANPEGKKYDSAGKELPCNPYTISSETTEAKAVYAKAQKITWSDESEQQIKDYLAKEKKAGRVKKALAWENEKENRQKKNPWRNAS